MNPFAAVRAMRLPTRGNNDFPTYDVTTDHPSGEQRPMGFAKVKATGTGIQAGQYGSPWHGMITKNDIGTGSVTTTIANLPDPVKKKYEQHLPVASGDDGQFDAGEGFNVRLHQKVMRPGMPAFTPDTAMAAYLASVSGELRNFAVAIGGQNALYGVYPMTNSGINRFVYFDPSGQPWAVTFSCTIPGFPFGGGGHGDFTLVGHFNFPPTDYTGWDFPDGRFVFSDTQLQFGPSSLYLYPGSEPATFTFQKMIIRATPEGTDADLLAPVVFTTTVSFPDMHTWVPDGWLGTPNSDFALLNMLAVTNTSPDGSVGALILTHSFFLAGGVPVTTLFPYTVANFSGTGHPVRREGVGATNALGMAGCMATWDFLITGTPGVDVNCAISNRMHIDMERMITSQFTAGVGTTGGTYDIPISCFVDLSGTVIDVFVHYIAATSTIAGDTPADSIFQPWGLQDLDPGTGGLAANNLAPSAGNAFLVYEDTGVPTGNGVALTPLGTQAVTLDISLGAGLAGFNRLWVDYGSGLVGAYNAGTAHAPAFGSFGHFQSMFAV